jgi:signal transduction histidine kinase
MRFTVATKIGVFFALVLSIGLSAIAFIYRGLGMVTTKFEELANIETPLTASAYEMEININGIGFQVLKYLATENPYYRNQALQDDKEFWGFHRRYMQLSKTERQRALGDEIGSGYRDFWLFAEALLKYQDDLTSVEQVYERLEAQGRLIEEHRDTVVTQHRRDLDQFAKVVILAATEEELAEVGFWCANYQRRPNPRYRELLLTKLANVKRHLADYQQLRMTADDRRIVKTVLGGAVELIDSEIDQVLTLSDQIRRAQQKFIDLRLHMDELLDRDIQVLTAERLKAPRAAAERAVASALKMVQFLIPVYVLTAVAMAWLSIRLYLVPLRQLTRGFKAMERGDLMRRVAVKYNDEFADLARGFNDMVDQLQKTTVSRDSLERSEESLRGAVVKLKHEIAERERAEKERAELEGALRRSETLSAMGTLVAGVAHQVRNPLFGISSILDAMTEKFGDQPQYQRYLSVLRGEIERLNHLMRDLLDYGKPPALEEAEVTITDVVEDAIKACTSLREHTGIELVKHVTLPLPTLYLDRHRLAQVFQILMDNAIRHSPPGAQVQVWVRLCNEAGQKCIECAIVDAGPGFDPGDLPRVFEPFFTRRSGGTGLGLSLAQRIVEQHAGTITAANRPEGGAIMTVRLPLARSLPRFEVTEARRGT